MKNLYVYLTNQLHPGSLILTIALDMLWSVFEIGITGSFVGIICLPFTMAGVFLVCFTAVTALQRYAAHDEWPSALTKGLALGVVAALPFSVIGFGLAIVWGVLHLLFGADEEVLLLGKLTRGWRDIEVTLRSLAPPDIRNENFEEVINHLYNTRMIPGVMKDRLHELRRLRNIQVHEMSTAELSPLVDEVLVMRAAIQHRFLRY